MWFQMSTKDSNLVVSGRTPEVCNSKSVKYIALIQFESCYCHRFGGGNDEALNGHPLYGIGLELYSAHIIENSSWINEFIKMNSMHPRFKKEYWNGYKHYLFTFHDGIFEYVAKSYSMNMYKGNMEQVVSLATQMLFQ